MLAHGGEHTPGRRRRRRLGPDEALAARPKKAWKETREAFAERLREVCRRINGEYGVEGLCREFPMRIQLLIDNGGDNISK